MSKRRTSKAGGKKQSKAVELIPTSRKRANAFSEEWQDSLESQPRKKRIKVIPADTLLEIRKYLENPTKNGIWHLQAKWEPEGAISQYLRRELKQRFGRKETLQLSSGIQLKLSEAQKEEFYKEVCSKISTITALFGHLHDLDHQTTEIPEYTSIQQTLFQLIKPKKLKSDYREQYEYFEQNVYIDGFDPNLYKQKLYQIKRGAFVSMEIPLETGNINWVSTNPTPMETFGQFLKSLGKISDYSLFPVYSPEDVVFSSYFVWLKVSFPFLIADRHTSSLFERAFTEYSSESYTNCVSTIGLIAEDYFTQIYETFFRDVCPKGLTLGQIYDLIHSSIGRVFQSEPKKLTELTPVYNQIKQQLLNAESSPDSPLNKEMLILIRAILNTVREDREYFQDKFSNLNKRTESLSVFPKYLRENLNELIRYRNAAAHKTRIPIGPYEALRAVYCLVSLYIWWDSEKRAIDWKDDEMTILRISIERNFKVQAK